MVEHLPKRISRMSALPSDSSSSEILLWRVSSESNR